MTDVLSRFNSGKLWDFKGGIHPPEMKSQSNSQPLRYPPLVTDFYIFLLSIILYLAYTFSSYFI